MAQINFDGASGLARLHALMQAVIEVRGNREGTQEYLLGWLYGLADSGVLSADDLFTMQQRIGTQKFMQPSEEVVELYEYPGAAHRRVEGKDTFTLEKEIMAGGPFEDSRISRIHRLACDEGHELHFVAKHYLFLTRARSASFRSI